MPTKLSSILQWVVVLIFLVSGLSSKPALAEKDAEYINALSEEAKITSMKDETPVPEFIPELAVAADKSIDIEKLTDKIAQKIQQALGASNQVEVHRARTEDELAKKLSSEQKPVNNMAPKHRANQEALTVPKAKPGQITKAKDLKSKSKKQIKLLGTTTVQKDESLSKVSQRVYGNGNYYPLLYEANRDIIVNPDKIKVGLILKIPELP